MRVLMHARPGSDRVLAGDAVQARGTAAALKDLGVQADLIEGDSLPDPADYDLVHLFNLIPVEGTYAAFTASINAGKRVVLSTVFWDPSAFLARWDHGGEFGAWWDRTNELRRKILNGACLILPNGRAELDCLNRAFGPLPPYYLVPNGVDPAIFRPRPRRSGVEPHILCVGRISPRKNQLGLLEALRGTGIAVHFVGPVNDFAYYRDCRAAAWSGVRFLPETRGSRLAALYADASVHALVSWYETPGLASLEAAACGCRVVSTAWGCAKEYLQDKAWYCRPDDPADIRRAVLAAMAAPEPAGLSEMVRARFNWTEAAKATLAAYGEAVKGR